MQQRIDVTNVSPAAYRAVAALQTYVDQSGLDAKLRELIKVRASQINGCAYCFAMDTRDARELGETDERMHLLDA
jgi:AhpD family alkylhydroperoxidase